MYNIKENMVQTHGLQSHRNHTCFYKKATVIDVLGIFTISHDNEVIKRSWPELASKKHH